MARAPKLTLSIHVQRKPTSHPKESTTMTTYTCDNFKPIRYGDECGQIIIETAKDAARVFAARYARKMFGKRGTATAIRADSWTQDGRIHNFQAFVGRHTSNGGVSGRNEYFTVYVHD
jgi:hypothetical protein